MAEVFQINPHDNMTVSECLEFCARNSEDYSEVIVVGVDSKDKLIVRSSSTTRERAAFILLFALDHAKGL